MGFVLLAGLSALAALAALGVTTRSRLRGRAEQLVAATLLWNAIIILPIYVLGLLGHLTARSLAIASPIVSLATFSLATLGPGFPAGSSVAQPAGFPTRVVAGFVALLRDSARMALGLIRLPLDGLLLSWRARSLIFVGVAFAALLLPYLGVSAFLAQAMPHWDPLWYHDTIVGFTIQNHGFAMVDLPETLQKVNGYVRLGEMTQLWLVIFTDRRLADITNLLFAPAIAAAVYVLARRYASPLLALGWGVAIVIMPTCAGLLHSTYVDPQYGALLLGSVVFATVDPPRLRDAWLASLGLALTIGSKGLALVPVPVAGLLGAGLLLHTHWHHRRRAAIATVLGGMVLILAMASTTYLRNYWAFHNPLWPDMRVDIPSLGIRWPGQGPWSGESPNPAGMKVDLNEPYSRLFDHLFALPWSVKGMFFDQAIEYGIGIIWVAIPLGALAFVACLIATVRSRLPPPLGLRAPMASLPILIALILAAIVEGSPALWGPRYHIAGVGLLGVMVAWFTGRPARERLGESAVATVLVTSLMMFWWTPAPRWWYSPEQLGKLAKLSPTEREVDGSLGAPTPRVVGLARERELGPGKLLLFDDRYSGFPSLFWNNTFSNRVVYLKSGPDWLAHATQLGATWVFLSDRELYLIKAARLPGSGWQEVGILNGINGGSAFRRIPIPPAAPKPPPPKVVMAPAPVAPKPPLPPPTTTAATTKSAPTKTAATLPGRTPTKLPPKVPTKPSTKPSTRSLTKPPAKPLREPAAPSSGPSALPPPAPPPPPAQPQRRS